MWNGITDQGMFGVLCAVLGLAAGIYLSKIMRRNREAAAKRKRDSTPPVYASRQEMRKAERERAKKHGR